MKTSILLSDWIENTCISTVSLNQKQQGQKQEEKKDMTLNSVEGVGDKGLRFGWKRALDVKIYILAFLIKGKLQHSQKLY